MTTVRRKRGLPRIKWIGPVDVLGATGWEASHGKLQLTVREVDPGDFEVGVSGPRGEPLATRRKVKSLFVARKTAERLGAAAARARRPAPRSRK